MPGFAVERKQLSDFCSYCGVERDRTVKKMERFREMEWVGLIVEVDEKDLLCPQEFSKVSPETLRQAINSFEIRYHIHTYFNHDRDACARKLLDWAVKFYQVKREV
jgi:ERCC4-type nuclease